MPSSSNFSLDRIHPVDTNVPYSNIREAPLRSSNILDRPSQSFPNQYPERGMPVRPADNTFESNVGRGDFRGRNEDYRGGMSDLRGPMYNFRSDYREGPNDFRMDFREGPDDFRDGQSGFRGNDFRGIQGNMQDDMRNKGGDYRSNFGYPRGGPPHKSGNYNNSNRQNNFSGPRYPSGTNFNPQNRW